MPGFEPYSIKVSPQLRDSLRSTREALAQAFRGEVETWKTDVLPRYERYAALSSDQIEALDSGKYDQLVKNYRNPDILDQLASALERLDRIVFSGTGSPQETHAFTPATLFTQLKTASNPDFSVISVVGGDDSLKRLFDRHGKELDELIKGKPERQLS